MSKALNIYIYIYCSIGIGVHHQNTVAETKIKKTATLDAHLYFMQRKWSTIIVTALWLFALTAVVKRHNCIDLKKEIKSSTERFSKTEDEIVLTDFHTWGCSVFVLKEENQSGLGSTPKWDPRSCQGYILVTHPVIQETWYCC